MAKTFNCGIGAILVVDADAGSNVLDQVRSSGQTASIIGNVKKCLKGILVYFFSGTCKKGFNRNHFG